MTSASTLMKPDSIFNTSSKSPSYVSGVISGVIKSIFLSNIIAAAISEYSSSSSLSPPFSYGSCSSNLKAMVRSITISPIVPKLCSLGIVPQISCTFLRLMATLVTCSLTNPLTWQSIMVASISRQVITSSSSGIRFISNVCTATSFLLTIFSSAMMRLESALIRGKKTIRCFVTLLMIFTLLSNGFTLLLLLNDDDDRIILETACICCGVGWIKYRTTLAPSILSLGSSIPANPEPNTDVDVL
mmetsp:Transcript_0/g.3  ORF Transcript_0/g.3 Transcript_0/m.3 type:complete len:244 (-) Transcript_0:673-1404(-)